MTKRQLAIPCSAIVLLTLAVPVFAAEGDGILRTADGHPDLTGTYNAATLTPLQRPQEFGDNLELTPERADAIIEKERLRVLDRERSRGPVDEAPPEGGAPPIGLGAEALERSGAGSVGGYNNFWTDRGTDVFTVDGKFRTSIITDPKNGRMPATTEQAKERFSARRSLFRPNDGTAWWVEVDGPGPYDGPESLGIAERCILGFTGAAPTFPSLYNNYKSIVQTEDYVMILIEMVHDARIVRMSSAEHPAAHPPTSVRKWLGDSIGWWEGDTLVVETTNYHPQSNTRGGTANLKLTERFTRQADGNVLYRFTMEDDATWTEPWSGEYIWRASDSKVYEYACHEGNYAMGNIMRGARLLEAEAMEKTGSSGD